LFEDAGINAESVELSIGNIGIYGTKNDTSAIKATVQGFLEVVMWLSMPVTRSSPTYTDAFDASGTLHTLIENTAIDIERTCVADGAIDVQRITDGHVVVSIAGKKAANADSIKRPGPL
jgi:hypothetical protein